ncbi:MAG: hypothetical protein LWW87_06960 [Geobacteraceae bacterium]|nr:hypothetical protein [Geobacteraceae bacterium]
MKKLYFILWALIATLFIYSATSHAAQTPFALTAAELAAPQIVRSGVNLLIPASATVNVPSMGTASTAGIARNMIARVGGFKGIATIGIVAIAGYAAWVDAHSNEFPISYKLLHPDAPPTVTNSSSVLPKTGTIQFVHNGKNWGNGTYAHYYSGGCTNVCLPGDAAPIITDSGWKITVVQNYDYGQKDVWTAYPVASFPPSPAVSGETFAQSLDQSFPTVVPEIDKYIQASPESVQVPSGLPIEIYKLLFSEGLASEKLANEKRVEASNDVVESLQLKYNQEPTTENKVALDKAVADYNKAVADSSALDKQVADNDSAAPPPTPPYDEINFQPIQDMGDALSDKFPFSLLNTLKNFAQGLVASPVAPHFTIEFPAPFNFQWNVSLERFDDIARMIGMAFLAYVTMALLRRFQ